MPINATGTFSSDCITACFTGTFVSDYIGDASVPNGTLDFLSLDPGSVELSSLEILGIDVKLSSLPEDLQGAILSLADEVTFTYDGSLRDE